MLKPLLLFLFLPSSRLSVREDLPSPLELPQPVNLALPLLKICFDVV